MAGSEGFIEHLKELFEPPGSVVFRKMFGGYGLFREGLMFGLVADGTLYLKADDENRPGFEARGLEPFTYVSARGEFSMSYHRAPEEAMDNSREMAPWAHSAFSAAQRAAAGKTSKSSKKRSASNGAGTSSTKTAKKKTAGKKVAKKKTATGSTAKKPAVKKTGKKVAGKTASKKVAKKTAATKSKTKTKKAAKKTAGKAAKKTAAKKSPRKKK